MDTVRPDRLAALLDAVGRCLDDAAITGAGIAAWAHVSRYHFDRLVTAGSGEAPGALRRRILLERAAHTLATTDRPVTVVALDAGYGSPEAFSRAFHRAFGWPPSRHRLRRVAEFRIAGASDVHFHPPGGIRLPAAEGDSMTIVNDMIDHHLHVVDGLLAAAQPLPADVLDRTFPYRLDYGADECSIRDLLAQLVFSCERWVAAMSGTAGPDESADSVSALRERLAAAGPRWRAMAREALDAGRGDETFIDTLCEPARTFTYAGSIAHVLAYGAVHRALAAGALRAEGAADLPSADPATWPAGG